MEAQRVVGSSSGPGACEPSKFSAAVLPRGMRLGHIAKDEDGDFQVVHFDAFASTDEGEDSSEEDDDAASPRERSSGCDDDSDGDDDDDDVALSNFPEDEATGEEKVAELGPLLGSLSPEILMLQVLVFLPVLGRTLCTKVHTLLEDVEESKGDSKHSSEDKTTTTPKSPPKSLPQPQPPQQCIPAGTAPCFPLQISLRRHFSSAQSLDYKLLLRSLHESAPLEMIFSDEEGKETAWQQERSGRELPADRVAQVFREVRALKAKQQGQPEMVETGRKHFEVTVDDAQRRRVLKHVYCYSFPRTPVDALLEALLSGNMAVDEEDADDEAEDL